MWHVRVCPVRADAGAEPSRENHLTLPVHKWLGEFPPASFCGCLEERGKNQWGLCWPRWPMPSEMGDSTQAERATDLPSLPIRSLKAEGGFLRLLLPYRSSAEEYVVLERALQRIKQGEPATS